MKLKLGVIGLPSNVFFVLFIPLFIDSFAEKNHKIQDFNFIITLILGLYLIIGASNIVL